MKLANLKNLQHFHTHARARTLYCGKMRGYKEGMTSNGGGGQTDDAGES